MVAKNDLLGELPPLNNEIELVSWRQSTAKIYKEILKTHERYETEYDAISAYFDRGDIDRTSNLLWDFCKRNIRYVVETDDEQTVKSPTAILEEGYGDCKHYSLFIGGVLDSIKQTGTNNGNWDWVYRFAGYQGKSLEHVFVVVILSDGRELWIDPVLSAYNKKTQPTYYIDKKPMALYRISGIGEATGKTISVEPEIAEKSFLVMVNLNLYGLKSFLLSNMQVTSTAVKNYMDSNGMDYNQLLLILNA